LSLIDQTSHFVHQRRLYALVLLFPPILSFSNDLLQPHSDGFHLGVQLQCVVAHLAAPS
jgi:hypothetical protein